MKMKEVCTRTGLTERTVRFYIEEGLLVPERRELNGRSYFNFSEEDVRQLECVAVLRKAQFSIAQIIVMKENPDVIAATVSALQAELGQELSDAQESVEALKSLAGEDFGSLDALAAALRDFSAGRSLPPADREPHFGRFDGVTQAEKRQAYAGFLVSSEKRARLRRWIAAVCAGVVLVAASVLITLGATGQLGGGAAPETSFTDTLISQMSDRVYHEDSEPPRAVFTRRNGTDVPAVEYLAGGIDGVTGNVTAQFEWDVGDVYGENGVFTVWTDVLVELEIETAEALGLPDGEFHSAGTPENRIEGIFHLSDGRVCAVYLESDTLSETVLLDIAQCFDILEG